MTDQPEADAEPELPPYMMEGARSGRSKCKTCRKVIEKGALRLGIRVEGPYGMGFMWHHLTCAAKRQFPKVTEAYEAKAWTFAKEEPEGIPELAELALLAEEAEAKKKDKQELPYAELDPSGRAKCKHSGESIPKGSLRVVLGREVTFGSQTRVTPIQVLPKCVGDALLDPECSIDAIGFEEALRSNTKGLDEAQLSELMEAIGPLTE